MTFSSFNRKIELHDIVILYVNPYQIYAIYVRQYMVNKMGELVEYTFQTQYGALDVSTLVGKEFGSKVRLSRGYAYVLYPTPELWTQTLPHRTQILYTPDISLIITELDIGPGSIVCEAGTGSGSLSHAFLRAIGDNGVLHSCDFHEDRLTVAQMEVEMHGYSSRAKLSHRDVCADGWDVEQKADAVFLDIPKPWEAVHHAIKAIKSTGGRICSFSPCVEQVSRTCETMRKCGLVDLNTVECLQREFQMKNISVQPVNVKQLPINQMRHMIKKDDVVISAKKMKTSDDSTEIVGGADSGDIADNKLSENNGDSSMETVESDSGNAESGDVAEKKLSENTGDCSMGAVKQDSDKAKDQESVHKFKSAVALLKMPGHTGFLTFATVPPSLSCTVSQT